MSRPFRPRPLDIHKKLPIVKSVKDLDIDEAASVSRASFHANSIAYSEVEQVVPPATKRKAGEIPTPQFIVVDSYERDYLRTFVQPSSYVRGRGARNDGSEYVEYDLDDEDDDWLEELNREKTILSEESFEWLLYKLEILDFKARERMGSIAMFGVPVHVLLHQEAAFEALRTQVSKPAVFTAIFEYWKTKREKWQKPILRRLQPPPPVNDTNPFNVFRPREKVHRPHTRRMQRRENDVLSFEKLRQIHCNLEQARSLLGILQKREEKKRELLDIEVNLQRTRITLKHDNELDDELVMEENMISSTPLARKSSVLVNGHPPIHPPGEATPPCNDGAVMLEQGDYAKCTWRRRRAPFQARGRPSKRVAITDSMEPVLLFVKPLDPEKLASAGIVPPLDPPCSNGADNVSEPPYRFQGRIGRGGRIIFDRWNPLTRTPLGCSNNFSSFPRRAGTLARLHPPPPRLNIEKGDVDGQPIPHDDGNLDKVRVS
ncbi:hypothetical protein KP509_04G111800 [Ceratopteris richardii]|uniref:Enhancer of polycomb-like protein n=1 Tax=Ceratopteris richardii TaxID=49495 RepID=A0A8T2V3Y5_CERRI|nr:hypothetical protein KP509_04G111800 [Ceratopteris richardii]